MVVWLHPARSEISDTALWSLYLHAMTWAQRSEDIMDNRDSHIPTGLFSHYCGVFSATKYIQILLCELITLHFLMQSTVVYPGHDGSSAQKTQHVYRYQMYSRLVRAHSTFARAFVAFLVPSSPWRWSSLGYRPWWVCCCSGYPSIRWSSSPVPAFVGGGTRWAVCDSVWCQCAFPWLCPGSTGGLTWFFLFGIGSETRWGLGCSRRGRFRCERRCWRTRVSGQGLYTPSPSLSYQTGAGEPEGEA